MYHRSGKWKIKEKKKIAPKSAAVKPREKEFGKKKEKRQILPKTPRMYPTEDVPKPLPSNRKTHHPTRLRSSITPGTVLILLAGRFRGKRVVFLKQLPSGLLLVTGPYKINGVPIRRVNQAFVIATSTKVDFGSLKIDDKFNDDYFRRPKKEKKKKTEAEFFATETKKKEIAPQRIADQKAFDTPLLQVIKKTPFLTQYLGSKFSLTLNQVPHELKF
jgi:large subunit ribosomal protein L6e